MITDWEVVPGKSFSGSIWLGAATRSKFTIKTGKKNINLVFSGTGLSAGGPISAIYSDEKTPSHPGKLVTSGYGTHPIDKLLTNPADGLIFSAGTAPRHIIPGGSGGDISGGYIIVLIFGVISSVSAITSFFLDHHGEPNGGFFAGAHAYAELATAAKGIDLGSASLLSGTWLRMPS